MSDTPETDAAWDAYYRGAAGLRSVRDKMEGFERQLNKTRAEAARFQMELDASCNSEELRQVREENARLRGAIKEILAAPDYTNPELMVRNLKEILTP